MKPKVLITGSGGYLGSFVLKRFLESRKYNLLLSFDDLTDAEIQFPQADVVLHLAGKPNSFRGSSEEIINVNYEGTVNLARKSAGSPHFVFLSSDYVFRSDRDKRYDEDSEVCPETDYGSSKAMAEATLRSELDRLTILRTSMLYGYDHPRRQNFFKFVEDKLSQGQSVELFSDVYSRPSHVNDVCKVIERVIDERLFGVYHASGPEYVSRYDLGSLICSARGFDLNLVKAANKPENVKIPQFLDMRTSAIFEAEMHTKLDTGVNKWQ
jgi:dTDP-4-dehydrorhamnose reductase